MRDSLEVPEVAKQLILSAPFLGCVKGVVLSSGDSAGNGRSLDRPRCRQLDSFSLTQHGLFTLKSREELWWFADPPIPDFATGALHLGGGLGSSGPVVRGHQARVV